MAGFISVDHACANGYNPDQNMAGFISVYHVLVAMITTLARTWQFQLAMLVASGYDPDQHGTGFISIDHACGTQLVTTQTRTWQALFQLTMLVALVTP